MNTISAPGASPLLGLTQRLPPSNLQAEQALLGALLANNKAFERVAEFLAAEHFADPIHGKIFQAIQRRVDVGQLADAITLRTEFEHNGVLDEVGGTAYLAQLLTAMVGIINAGEYGRAIHDAWLRRQLIDVGEEVVNNAFGADPELMAATRWKRPSSGCSNWPITGPRPAGSSNSARHSPRRSKSAESAFRRPGHVSGLSTGLRDLDKKMGGLHPSDLIILAGRPGMGKTALATKIAFGAARSLLAEARADDPNAVSKGSVAFFSLEMSADQIALRLLAEEARVSGDRIRRGEIGQKDFDKFVQVSRRSPGCRCISTRCPACRWRRCARAAGGLKRTSGAEPGGGGLFAADAAIRGHQAREPRAGNQPVHPGAEGAGEGTGGAGDRAVAAIPRGGEPGGQAAAARGSARVGHDRAGRGLRHVRVSRRILFADARAPKQQGIRFGRQVPCRTRQVQQDMERVHNRAELIIEKQRHGPTGKIDLMFEGEFTRFADLDLVHEEH